MGPHQPPTSVAGPDAAAFPDARSPWLEGSRPIFGPQSLWAAELVLQKHRRPLRAREIVTYAQEQGLFSDEMHSRTPQKSLQARLSLDILQKGERSIFIRTARGLFYLRNLLADETGATFPDEGLGL